MSYFKNITILYVKAFRYLSFMSNEVKYFFSFNVFLFALINSKKEIKSFKSFTWKLLDTLIQIVNRKILAGITKNSNLVY